MKVIFTGGGTGGHFYPLIAVAEELNKLVKDNNITPVQLYYLGPTPYNPKLLEDNNLIYKQSSAGKIRSYGAKQGIFDHILNFFDSFKTLFGIVKSVFNVFSIYPDIIFAKGGYASFPTLFAAKILFIPVIIHESDTVPGRVNKWAGKFAKRIAVSFPQASKYFNEDKVAYTGQPIRASIKTPTKEGAREFLRLEKDTPVILILGGSQGALMLNRIILKTLNHLVENYQIIHQVGESHFEDTSRISKDVLADSSFKDRYKVFGFLNDEAMRMVAGVSSLVISRAGSTIFEIASWGLPSILIPITESVGNHQIENSFAYARSGSCVVIEEKNLNPDVFVSEVNKLMSDALKREDMSDSARKFHKDDSANKIAREILKISLKHDIQ